MQQQEPTVIRADYTSPEDLTIYADGFPERPGRGRSAHRRVSLDASVATVFGFRNNFNRRAERTKEPCASPELVCGSDCRGKAIPASTSLIKHWRLRYKGCCRSRLLVTWRRLWILTPCARHHAFSRQRHVAAGALAESGERRWRRRQEAQSRMGVAIANLPA